MKRLPVQPASPADPDFMLSLARGLSVIRAFEAGPAPLSIAEAARITGMSRAAARRCLHTLEVLGYVASAGGGFELTPVVLSLGHSYLDSNAIARAAQPVLERVSAQVHESSSLAVLDGDEIVYVARAATQRILSISISVGSRLPAAVTSMGRAILAFSGEAAVARFLSRVRLTRRTAKTIVDKGVLKAELGRIRRLGYALVDQELELGLRSLAVPILRADGVPLAAINVGVHVGRSDVPSLKRDVLPVLLEAAREIAGQRQRTTVRLSNRSGDIRVDSLPGEPYSAGTLKRP
jgi:IclR family pca regulon transcriptional regulator